MSISKQLFLILFFAAMLLLLVSALSLTTVSAQDLPPRPEPTATPQPTAVPDPAFVGGTIHLRLVDETVDTTDLWTAVQWQDTRGDWHTVEGWQGTFNPSGAVTWWVASDDLATGPFRWQIFATKDGDLLTSSDAFYLPETTGQTVTIEVSSPN